MILLIAALVLLCLFIKPLRGAAAVFVIVFAVLCLTHDWSKDTQSTLRTVSKGKP